MAECPFCATAIDEALTAHGGTCPACFAEIPGEETATDPGEEVKAQMAREDQARARRRAMVPVLLATPLVLGVFGFGVYEVMKPDPVVEPITFADDAFTFEIDLAEYVEPEPEPEPAPVAAASKPTSSKRNPSASAAAPAAASGSADPEPEPSGAAGIASSASSGLSLSGGLAARRSAALLVNRDDIQSAVKDLFRSRLDRLQQCYERSLKNNPDLQGRWRVAFTIDTDGKAIDSSVEGIEMSSGPFEACLGREVATWAIRGRLEKPWPVSFPLAFKGG